MGTVIEKNYIPSSTTTTMVPMRVGGVTVMQPRSVYHSEEYNIVITADNITKTFDNEILYENYDVNDKIKMNILYIEYDDGSVSKVLKEGE